MNLSILIVEDSYSYALKLEIMCRRIGYRVIGIVDSSATALEAIHVHSPDLILMDININGKLNGIQVAQSINQLRIPILYLTGYDSDEFHANPGDTNMIGYLRKSLDEKTLESVLNMAILKAYFFNQDEDNKISYTGNDALDAFYFRKGDSYNKVLLRDINVIQADGNYCKVILRNGTQYYPRITLSRLKESLPEQIFFLAHRRNLVRLSSIEAFNLTDGTIQVGGNRYALSRTMARQLRNRLPLFG